MQPHSWEGSPGAAPTGSRAGDPATPLCTRAGITLREIGGECTLSVGGDLSTSACHTDRATAIF